jgi:hypothetical protein
MKGTTKGTTRKGTTNPRKSIRRIKPRKHKTRRQSGGGFASFITADDNPVNLRPRTYADQLKSAILKQKGKSGIDVKVELVDGKPKSWLIGGDGWSDSTFGDLERGAKDGRYQGFIDALKTHIPLWEVEVHFTNPGRSPETSKGIKLSHDQFCRLFINGPLDYPVLIQRFRERRYTCPGQSQQPQTFGPRYVPPPGPPPSSALRAPPPGPSAAVAQRVAPPPGPPPGPSAALRVAPSSAAGTSAAVTPQQSPVVQLVQMGFKEADVINALTSALGNVTQAVAILSSAAADQIPGARGGPSAAISAAPTRASINDFLTAQNGTFPRQLPQLSSNGSCPTYAEALAEIKSGQKASHWIWYIIPSSPGYSETSKFFGIGPRAKHASVTPEQYLSNPILSARYVDILTAIGAKLQQRNPSIVRQFLVELMDDNKKDVDYEKLRDSLAIFYPILAERKLVNVQISLLAQQLGVQPQHAPQPTLSRIVQYVPPSTAQQYAEPGPSAALRVALPDRNLPVEKLAFEPGIGDLMVPDLFVKKYADAYRLGFDQNESYTQDIHDRKLTDFADRTKCPEVANWTVMQTVGDGNCLTHAFLQCMSSNYRKLHVNNAESQEEKIAVAQAFRLAFARISGKFLNEGAKVELSTNNGLGDLSEATFASYARLFGVILVVFDVHNTQVIVANLTDETTAPIMRVIFVHGDGGHFSSVLPARVSDPDEPFVIKYADAIQSECLKKHLSLGNKFVLNL